MKKNKIITLILALAVCSSLILSLCSFTTITDEPNFYLYGNDTYSIDIYYKYHRTTSTIDQYLYGSIPEFNRILDDPNSSSTPSVLASSYLMLGTTSLDYTLYSWVTSPSIDYGNLELEIKTDNEESLVMSDRISLRGLFTSNNDYFNVSFFTSRDYSSYIPHDDVTISVNFSAFYYEDDVLHNVVEDYYYLPDLSFNSTYPSRFDVSVIVDYIQSQYEHLLYFTNLDIDFGTYQDVSVIRYYGHLYNHTARSAKYQELMKSITGEVYNDGVIFGYNQGISQAPNVWGGLGAFLSNAVGGFLDFEIIPGLSITNIVSLIVSVGVVLIFLKIFAGG